MGRGDALQYFNSACSDRAAGNAAVQCRHFLTAQKAQFAQVLIQKWSTKENLPTAIIHQLAEQHPPTMDGSR